MSIWEAPEDYYLKFLIIIEVNLLTDFILHYYVSKRRLMTANSHSPPLHWKSYLRRVDKFQLGLASLPLLSVIYCFKSEHYDPSIWESSLLVALLLKLLRSPELMLYKRRIEKYLLYNKIDFLPWVKVLQNFLLVLFITHAISCIYMALKWDSGKHGYP